MINNTKVDIKRTNRIVAATVEDEIPKSKTIKTSDEEKSAQNIPSPIDHDVETVNHDDESDRNSSDGPINDKNEGEYDNIDGKVDGIQPGDDDDNTNNGEVDEVRNDGLVNDGTAPDYNKFGETNNESTD